jgi:hypothetical protein
VISFRYHLVSIVAFFLALALGVLVGTTVVNQGLIEDLDRRTEAAVKNADELRRQVSDLRSEIQLHDRFAQAVEPLLVEGRLTGREVVMVTLEDVEASDVDTIRGALQAAGASVVTEMVITARMGLSDEEARSDLASALGMPVSTEPEALSESTAQELGVRLASGPASTETDLLERLATGGFLQVQGGSAFEGIGGASQPVVLLAGGAGIPIVDPAMLATVAETLAQDFHPVVAAETLQSEYPFVALVRQNGAIDGQVVTVDNADQISGRVAVVLGLRDLLLTPGRGGDYGVKEGASSLLPQP